MDLIDHTLPEKPISERSIRDSNAKAGVRFRHQTWERTRQLVREALVLNDPHRLAWIHFLENPELPDLPPAPLPTNRARRFDECGTRSVVLQSATDPTKYKIACERCHDRFCLPCMQDRARLIVANLKAQLSYAPTRFLTLTLKHSDEPLREQLDRLYTSFACLRRRKFWQESVTGGVAFLELKLSSTDDHWHPHLHVLLRGKYLPQKVIAKCWYEITGDSFIVDIRMARDPAHLYSYLTRYVTKGWDQGVYRGKHKLVEAMAALKGRKLLASFGDFAQLKLLAPPNAETWDELGTLHEVRILAERGIAWAEKALAAITRTDWTPPVSDVPPDP